MTTYPVDLNIALDDFERRIASEPIEVSGAFDGAGGLVLRPRSGSEDQVEYAESEMAPLADSIVTHNHPSGFPPSLADAEFAVLRNVAELRVVCPDGTVYRIVRPTSGWPSSEEMIETMEESFLAVNRMEAWRRLSGQEPLAQADRRQMRYQVG